MKSISFFAYHHGQWLYLPNESISTFVGRKKFIITTY
ncbi:unnamed protein product [Amoebophrya sp. A25]|nr:unnamed protein product [Amoebophrya sp. A25]|eukprot:GSA25T00017296001.1